MTPPKVLRFAPGHPTKTFAKLASRSPLNWTWR